VKRSPALKALRPDLSQAANDALEAGEDPAAVDWAKAVGDQIVAMPDPPEYGMADAIAALQILRAPFPPERIEKLPKPKWKGAWDDARGKHCDICHGYHVLENSIHLDYVGHANCTERLLEADPFWDWEPLAYTEAGTPLFTDGGLWIKLTVCGVTRIGFGDGKNVKEVIGDAIRNAAMRFGVALDLWSKVDLHEGVNAGDGKTSQNRSARQSVRGRQDGGHTDQQEANGAPPRAANQDALDTLQSVCDEHGYSTQYCIDRFAAENRGRHIRDGSTEDVLLFADELIREATAEPADGPQPADADGDVGDPADAATELEPSGDAQAGEGNLF